jgi:hypothetical protein
LTSSIAGKEEVGLLLLKHLEEVGFFVAKGIMQRIVTGGIGVEREIEPQELAEKLPAAIRHSETEHRYPIGISRLGVIVDGGLVDHHAAANVIDASLIVAIEDHAIAIDDCLQELLLITRGQDCCLTVSHFLHLPTTSAQPINMHSTTAKTTAGRQIMRAGIGQAAGVRATHQTV